MIWLKMVKIRNKARFGETVGHINITQNNDDVTWLKASDSLKNANICIYFI